MKICIAIASGLIAACSKGAKPEAPASPPLRPSAAVSQAASPVGSWRWVSIVTPVETIQAPATGEYTLVIGDSTATGMADCNRMTGKATWTDNRLTMGPMAMTRMACPPGGLGDRYAKFLGGAAGWFFRTDTLFVDLAMDSGTMRFVKGG